MTESLLPSNDVSVLATNVPSTDSPHDNPPASQADLMARLLISNLRTEAVKAGMIDLDGLKLLDLTSIQLDKDDTVVGGQAIMTELRRAKPWLFGALSSSSAAPVPASQPVRQKTAMDMTDEEYAAARKAITKYSL